MDGSIPPWSTQQGALVRRSIVSEGTEKFEALSIGAVFGGPSEDDQRWWPDIQWLMNAVIARGV